MLSDFRSQGGEKWDELLTQIVATLLDADLVKMDRVAQDGMRVRASAGKSSFRRQGRLEECLEAARQQVETLKQLAEEDGAELTRRQRAARERAARERQQRIEEAMRQCEELQQQREASAKQSGRKVDEARASTTDPEARVMKFPDGGYRPGYNVQFATDTESGVIVGVEVTNAGNDGEQLPPMLDQLKERYERVPDEALVDGGFATMDAIDQADDRGCTVYAPLKDEEKQRAAGKRSPCPQEGRQRCGCRVAEPNGDRGGEADLPAARPNGGVGQRAVPQPRTLAHARARPTALSHRRIVVCNCS